MIYKKKYKTDDDKKIIKCPICSNEDISHTSNNCKICGFYLFNKCADMGNPNYWNSFDQSCNTVLDSNARYCHNCGNESTFYQKGLLTEWYLEKFIQDYSAPFKKYDAVDFDFIDAVWNDILIYFKKLNTNFFEELKKLTFMEYLETNDEIHFVVEDEIESISCISDLEYLFKSILYIDNITVHLTYSSYAEVPF